MNLNSIKRKLKEILEDDFVSVEKGTWNDYVHLIHVRANYCSLDQAMEIARISGDADPIFCADIDYHLKIIIDLKNNHIKE